MISGNLRVTPALLETYADTFRGHDYCIINHLRQDTVDFVRCLTAITGRPVALFAPHYSVDGSCLDEIPSLEIGDHSIGHSIPDMLDSIRLHAARPTELPEIVVDVGGHYLAALGEAFRSAASVGVVEETKAGIWRYERVVGPRVVDVARSSLKAVEATYIGIAVVRGIEAEIADLGEVLRGAAFGLIGYGDIGSSVAEEGRARGCRIAVADTDPNACLRAVSKGFRVVSKMELLRTSEIVCGATGRASVTTEEWRHVRPNANLFSASSRNVEFGLEQPSAKVGTPNHADLEVPVDGGTAFIRNGGFPINFKRGSLPIQIGDLLFALVSQGMRQLISGPWEETGAVRESSIMPLAAPYQTEVAREWMKHWREQA